MSFLIHNSVSCIPNTVFCYLSVPFFTPSLLPSLLPSFLPQLFLVGDRRLETERLLSPLPPPVGRPTDPDDAHKPIYTNYNGSNGQLEPMASVTSTINPFNKEGLSVTRDSLSVGRPGSAARCVGGAVFVLYVCAYVCVYCASLCASVYCASACVCIKYVGCVCLCVCWYLCCVHYLGV